MKTHKDQTLSVISVLHISFFSQCGSFAAPQLLLWMAMVLFHRSCSSRHRALWLSVTSSAEYKKKHQIVPKVWSETASPPPSSLHDSLHGPHIPLSCALSLSLSLSLSSCLCKCLSLYPCQTNVALWPRSSTVSVEQLVSIRSPFRSLYARARTRTLAHTHTKKEWGGLLSLAHRSVDGVIESFDQNIWWSSEAPSAGCGHRSVSFH